MKSFKWAMLAGIMSFGLAAPAFAADPEPPPEEPVTDAGYQAMGFYLRGDIGWSFLEWDGGDDDDALTIGAGIGYQATDYLRGDVRVDYSGEYEVAPGADMSTVTVLGNMYFDVKNSTMITPYVGAGIGWGWANETPTGDENGLAFALMGGASVDLTEMVAFDLGYRFRDIMIDGDDVTDHSVLAGVRVKF
jgi:opacity protein-like surface antigen